jgi:thiaminase
MMPLSDTLRKTNNDLWEHMVTQPFVQGMGDGALPLDKFQL